MNLGSIFSGSWFKRRKQTETIYAQLPCFWPSPPFLLFFLWCEPLLTPTTQSAQFSSPHLNLMPRFMSSYCSCLGNELTPVFPTRAQSAKRKFSHKCCGCLFCSGLAGPSFHHGLCHCSRCQIPSPPKRKPSFSFTHLNYGWRTRAPWTKAPMRQKLVVFSTLFLGKNKLKQRNYTRTKLRVEELNKRENLIQKR